MRVPKCIQLVTEQDIIKGCIEEDKASQKELFLRYSGKMFTVCLRYARHRLEAEDMLQDAFVKVFDNIKSFKNKGSLEGWVRRIVVNTALKYYRKSSFQKEFIGLEDYDTGSVEPSVYTHLNEEELMGLLSELPEGYRLVFNLFALEGYSHKEIAEELGIKESTSRSQLVKARRYLQSRILEMYKIAL